MKEIKKLFARERKNIRLVAHEHHTKFYDNPDFVEVFEDKLHSIMEPVMASLKAYNRGYMTDILRDYDALKEALKAVSEDEPLVYVIGVRDMGTDSHNMIEVMLANDQEKKLSVMYNDLFFFLASTDVDVFTGAPIKFIDVHRLHLTTD